jgi:RNA polymerase sigma factor (sigma-70 family)
MNPDINSEQDPLEDLLAKLCNGDDAAAEQVFVTYEPFLRMVVRRMLPARLQAKFDSVDVVHSIWADLLHGFREAGWRFTDSAHLRAFLVKATRNRFLDRVRKHKPAMEHEQPLEGAAQCQLAAEEQPRPSEVAQANDLWERLLELCPPNHRNLLVLKRQGCSLEEIANRTGLHPSSVRRILYDLARRLAVQQIDEDDDEPPPSSS